MVLYEPLHRTAYKFTRKMGLFTPGIYLFTYWKCTYVRARVHVTMRDVCLCPGVCIWACWGGERYIDL